MDRTRVAVEIYGTSYNLVGSSTEYMKQVARHVDDHMRTISKAHSRLDTPRIAVLTAVHMAEQAIQVQDIKNELNMLTGERSEQRVEISRLLEVQEERQEEFERFQAAAKEEAARLIAVVEEERARNLEAREQELKIHAQQLQEAEQVAEAAKQQLKADLLTREQELTALRTSYTEEQEAARLQLEAELLEREQELAALQASYEEEQAADRETHRQELANTEAVHLQQLEELKAAHLQELESIRESLTNELVETRTLLSQELADTKLTLGKELSEEREALQRELAKTKELRQSQGTQEHRHKQNVQELEKQLSELRGGTGQLQARLRAAEAGLKGERDARLTLLTQYELVSKREEQLGEELRSTTELGALLSDELEGLRQRYDLSQDEAAMLRKSLQETSDSLRHIQAELARSTAEGSTWQELADKRMEDISELEMKLLEAEEKTLQLKNEIQALHGQADGLVQKLDDEGRLRTEAENESEMLREQVMQAQSDLSALRTRYEELISQYDEVLQDGERLQERYRLLEEEGEQAALRLEELSEASREAAAIAAEQQDVLKEAQTNGTSWKHKYEELVQRQQQWTDTEAQLREEIDIWQREVGEAEAKRESIDHERSDVLDQLGEVGENYEIVQGQLRLLQAQFEIAQSELDKLTDEHRKLQAEYAKLQTEYNEWIQLIEQDS